MRKIYIVFVYELTLYRLINYLKACKIWEIYLFIYLTNKNKTICLQKIYNLNHLNVEAKKS